MIWGCRVSVPGKILILFAGVMILTLPIQVVQSKDLDKKGRKSDKYANDVEPRVGVSKEDIEALKIAKKDNLEPQLVNAAAKILGVEPDNLLALNTLGVFYFRKGKLGLSKIILKRALSSHPDEPALHNNLGIIYLTEGDQRTAINFFKKSLDLDPDYSIAATNLASIYLEYQDYNRALSPLEDGYKVVREKLKDGEEESVGVANNLAVALSNQDQVKKAQDIYQEILDGPSKSIIVLLNYTVLLVERLKSKDEALNMISKIKFLADSPKVIRRVEQLEQKVKSLK